jgi:hypothetical protein
MTPAKLKGLLVWAALLLSLYWSLVEPDDQGLALALGLLLGAGSLLYRRGVDLVVPVALLALAVGVLEVQKGQLAPYLLGLLVGLFAPLGAARMLR